MRLRRGSPLCAGPQLPDKATTAPLMWQGVAPTPYAGGSYSQHLRVMWNETGRELCGRYFISLSWLFRTAPLPSIFETDQPKEIVRESRRKRNLLTFRFALAIVKDMGGNLLLKPPKHLQTLPFTDEQTTNPLPPRDHFGKLCYTPEFCP